VFINTLHAADAVESASQQAGWQTMLPLLIVFVVMYFLVIRPQNKRAKEQQQMQTAVKVGNQVLTSGGLIGKVMKAEEKELVVEFTPGQPVRVVRTAILGVVDTKEEKEQREAKNSEKTAAPKKKEAKNN
jgi:preprotein translocase subunit YajC